MGNKEKKSEKRGKREGKPNQKKSTSQGKRRSFNVDYVSSFRSHSVTLRACKLHHKLFLIVFVFNLLSSIDK